MKPLLVVDPHRLQDTELLRLSRDGFWVPRDLLTGALKREESRLRALSAFPIVESR